MFAAWLVIYMDGVACDAVAVCEEHAQSCEATVVSCEGSVRLSACLNEGSAYSERDMAHYGEDGIGRVDPVYVLGCSTDLSLGWPAFVDLDRYEIEGVL